jgi:hypothetical protein
MALFEGAWLQVHQLNALPGDRDSLDEIIDLAKDCRAGGIMLKAFDGDAWMGSEIRFPDTAADALRSIDQIAEQKATCDRAGIGYAVWVNPLHPADFHLGVDFLDRQADLYAAAGNAAGRIVFDSEDGAGFWGANRPVGHARRLMERFRNQAPDVVTVWQPDGRQRFNHLDNLRPSEWAPHMNVYAPQVYFTAFQRPFADELEIQFATFEELKAHHGMPANAEWRPTFGADSPSNEILAAMTMAANDQNATGCIIFHLAGMRRSTFDVIRQAA